MNLIERAACIERVYAVVVSACVLLCAACGIEGGVQLHLSHDHPAFACVALAMSQGERSPTCTAPDESGQPWRLRLVGLDMAGFVTFGLLYANVRAARRRARTAARTGRDRVSDM